jgi:hypothetical protein
MIEKVGYSKPVASARSVRRANAAGGAEFAEALARAEGAAAAGGVEAANPIAALSSTTGLLGIQEVSEDEHHRRRAVKKGRLTLDALAKLRDALLIGTLPLATIRQLEQIVAEERGTTSDPVLNGILDEIELRAAVEIAKLEVAGIRV